MVGIDDSGEVGAFYGDNIQIIPKNERYPTLGSKRNAVARLAYDAEILCVWDDDDLWMPWSLSAIAKSAKRADWIRPSQILSKMPNGNLSVSLAHSNKDASDKAFQGSWGVARGAFHAVDGYPDELSLGEDLLLARRLRDAMASEADPIQNGFKPYHIAAPYENQHFSWTHKDYKTWCGENVSEDDRVVKSEPPPFPIGKIEGRINQRAWQTNWWNDEVKA